MPKMIVKSALRAARKKLGLSQAAIAAKLGITSAAVSHYESGIAKPPLERAKQLARVLKIDMGIFAVSSRAMRGSRRQSGRGSRTSKNEAEVLAALRSMPLAKRRPAIEMLLAYAARVKNG